MRNKIAILTIISLVLLLLTACSSAETKKSKLYKVKSGSSIATVAVTNSIENSEWRDKRIGFGLTNYLSQLLYDSGKFKLIEEKKGIIPEEIWELGMGEELFVNKIKTSQYSSDFIAYGNILFYGKPKSNLSVGIFHKSEDVTIIRAEVIISDIKNNIVIKGKGEGRSKRSAESALFSYNSGRVELDKSNIGIAVREALENAMKDLMEQIEFE